MRVWSLLCFSALLVTCVFAVEVSPVEEAADSTELELIIATSFPESNPFGHIVNGETNQLFLEIENKSGKNITLLNVAGELHHPETDKLIKATNNLTYGINLIEGAKIRLPYSFYSEFKTGDVKLNLWLEHITDGAKYRVSAYDSVVTIVEPELSIFDLKLLSTYAMVIGVLSGLGYFAYITFVPQQAKKIRKPTISAPVSTVIATGAGGYEEEWIPQHHLKKGKGKKAGAVSSGDELSGAETSGAEGKRKARK
ncbi:hypothetical protein HETIRDRAFT_107017 [Heterobasidion irregulare TC 32-1]|uniref:Translocon-associated protein subunit alpha n=1 Tax=Heterobasidion irregulare (strain TC 32-1) TaxID=747525 RepID=W4KAK6_HETIT|nr:uncharacterized protein HETIRDRAFT_107017 [Heterobasidion irregulare TC 32-1]ETW82852.1 hypothetical protein HETIRDRAFT_107017 [Heterobasidion irregulare TC 32-1]